MQEGAESMLRTFPPLLRCRVPLCHQASQKPGQSNRRCLRTTWDTPGVFTLGLILNQIHNLRLDSS